MASMDYAQQVSGCPNQGILATMLSQEHIIPVVGPLSTSLEGVKIFMKTLIEAKPWLSQPCLLPIPWRMDQNLALQVRKRQHKAENCGLWDDGVVKPHPPVTRALRELSERLKSVPGVELVDWKPYKHDLAWEIIVRNNPVVGVVLWLTRFPVDFIFCRWGRRRRGCS